MSDGLFSLDGRTVVITGASGFLGRAMSRAVLEHGARLVAMGRSERLDVECATWAREFGQSRVRACRVDMRDDAALERALGTLATEEQVDVLVNNAHALDAGSGFNVKEGALEQAGNDVWLRNLTSGVWWPALATRVLGSSMVERRRGSIINIASMYAIVAPSPRLYEGTSFLNPAAYSAAKSAMLALTRYTASFWGRFGVRANAIAPGPFSNTEEAGSNSVAGGDPFLDRLRERTCLGRTGVPRELAGPVVFLASDASSYITGHCLVADGGWTII
jgi:gluconate 5-dehydrogenase